MEEAILGAVIMVVSLERVYIFNYEATSYCMELSLGIAIFTVAA